MPGKRKFSKFTKSNSSQSKQIAKNARAIKQLKAQPEKKVVYAYSGFAAPSSVGVHVHVINGLQQGTTESSRIGDQVIFKHLNMNVYFESQGVTLFRAIILKDTQNNGSTSPPPSSDIFNHSTSNNDKIVSTFNFDIVGNDKRYRILYDSGPKLLEAGTGNSNERRMFMIKKRIPLNNRVIYSSNLGTAADIVDNRYMLYLVFNDLLCKYTSSAQMEFIDS